MSTIAIHHIEDLPGSANLQVISIEDKLEGDRFFVRLAESGNPDEHEDTPFEDYPQAYAHWRSVLATFGVIVPYLAPQGVQVFDASQPAVRGAVEVYYEFHGELSRYGAGMIEATAVRDRFMADPVFIENASEILHLAGEKVHDWRAATIRTSCRRVMAAEKAKSEQAILASISNLENFGAF